MEELFTADTPDLFADVSTTTPTTGAPGNSVTPRLVAVNETENPLAEISEQTLKIANERLANGEEQQIRLATALKRQQRQATALASIRRTDRSSQILTDDDRATIDETYNRVVTSNIEETARTAVEREAVDRINDAMAEGDSVEAKLINRVYFGSGTAMKVYHDEATKNLLLAQKISQYENEGEDTGVLRSAFNFVTGFIPLNSNFANTGVVPGVASNLKSWLLSGTARQAQGEALWNNYTPDQLAAALADGGELDNALRNAGTTLGSFDANTSADILKSYQAQSASDKQWSNVWSVADPLLLAPWTKVGSIPGVLTRMGARKAATKVATDAVEAAIRMGPEEGARLTGISSREAVESLETSAMRSTASTPNSVPAASDVAARLERNRAIFEELGGDIELVNRATNPDEIREAISAKASAIKARYGNRIKDIEHYVEDVPTGTLTRYTPGDALPSQGNSLMRVRVTLGKAGGGGYATPASALSNALTKLGLVGRVVGSNVEQETIQTAAEAGFKTRAFHGTGGAFKDFDPALDGITTGATHSATFFTTDPKMANSYAIHAADAANQREAAILSEKVKTGAITDEEMDRYADLTESIADHPGANIRPVDLDTRGFIEHDMTGDLRTGPEKMRKARERGAPGVILRNYADDGRGGTIADVIAVFDQAKVRSSFEGPVIKKDVSGQYFAQADVHVPLEGFVTTPLNTPDNGFFRFGRSYARRLDRNAQQKAVAAGLSTSQLQTAIAKRTREALKGLSKEDHGNLDAVIRAGQNKDAWLDQRQLDTAWERLTGQPEAPERVRNAYQAYQDINDVDFFMRRNEIYRRDANVGRENLKVHLGKTGQVFDGTALVKDSGQLPTGRVFNTTDNVHYSRRNPLTNDEWERLKGDGYILVETKEAVELPNGLRLNQLLVKSSQTERSTLKLEKGLGYKAGGHRAYTGNYFIKQAAAGVQPDDGAEFLLSPHVWRTGNNPNRLREWAQRWNSALASARRGITDPTHYDDDVFANLNGLSFPTGEEFVEGVKSGRITTKYEAEVVGDREMPTQYINQRDDIDRFLDETEIGDGGYYRTTGRMYTSARGSALLDESGEFAATVDPWEMTDRAISNISRMSSFSNYKDNLLERFKATYGNDLKLRQLEDATPFEMMNAEVRDHVKPELATRIKAEQVGFANIMNHETAFDKSVRQRTKAVAEYVLGDATGGARELGHDFVYWLSKKNPVNFLRGLAFDAKLGLFNIGQLFLQASTMATSIALSPRAGLKGAVGAVPLFAFQHSLGSEAVLDTLAKRGVWKAASFESEKEFKDFARFVYKSGLLDVNKTHLNVNDMRPTRFFGAANKVDAVREHGRVFFYSAEVLNRSTAARIAYEELKDAGVQLGSSEFRERFAGLADDYSMNMMGESSASFQHGLWSIPTQFWGYNVRMMDAMFGSRFTPAQRTRLVLTQLGLYGMGGIPVFDAIDEYVRAQTGASADAGTLQGLISRGALDNALAAVSGADVRVGERLGSGSFLTDTVKKTGLADVANSITKGVGIGEILHVSEYDRLSLAELAGGATASISGAGMKTVADLLKFSVVEGGSGDITRENLLKVADNISTFSNFHKAWLVNQYGIYKSQKGTVLGADIPSEDALWFGLGLGRPQEADTAQFQMTYMDNKETVIKEAATQVRNWRQEAFSRPDMIDANVEKQRTLLALYPPDVQREIMKRTNRITDKSFFDRIQAKFDNEANEVSE